MPRRITEGETKPRHAEDTAPATYVSMSQFSVFATVPAKLSVDVMRDSRDDHLTGMHELSIALSIVDVAGAEAERRGLRATAVHLTLGALSGVVKDALEFAWPEACRDSPLEGAKLVIRDVPVMVNCPTCQCERPVRSVWDMCCEVCGTPTAQVTRGREIEITALEVLDGQPDETGGSPPESAQAK